MFPCKTISLNGAGGDGKTGCMSVGGAEGRWIDDGLDCGGVISLGGPVLRDVGDIENVGDKGRPVGVVLVIGGVGTGRDSDGRVDPETALTLVLAIGGAVTGGDSGETADSKEVLTLVLAIGGVGTDGDSDGTVEVVSKIGFTIDVVRTDGDSDIILEVELLILVLAID